MTADRKPLLRDQLLAAISRAQLQCIENVEGRILFDRLLTNVLELTSSSYGFIGDVFHQPDGTPYLQTQAITNIAWNEETRKFYDENAPEGLKFYNLETLFGRVITSGEALISNNPSSDPRRGGLPKGHPAMHAFAGLPLYRDGTLIGMIGLANRPGGYDEALIDFLSPLAQTCALIMEVYRNDQQRLRTVEALRQSYKALGSYAGEGATRLRETEARLITQQSALLNLTTHPAITHGDMKDALHVITEVAAQVLGVTRAGIWIKQNNPRRIQCLDLYQKNLNQHTVGDDLVAEDHPRYFKALEKDRAIAAHDALHDADTQELSDSYLIPLGITSLLDAPLRRGGINVGVICHEHTGPQRHWTLDEQNFAGSIADLVMLVIEANEGKQTQALMMKLSTALEQTADAVIITDRNGVIEYANPAFETMTGFSHQEIIGQSPNILKSGRHDPAFYKQLWDTIRSGRVFQDVFINSMQDGTLYYEEKTISPMKDANGNIVNFVATGKDITERMQTQERLQYLAYHDLLTELPNRALFVERLTHALSRRHECDDLLAVIIIDIDQFKVINDTLGHDVGDELLQMLSKKMRKHIREGDTFARFGGDEFAILLEEITSSDEVTVVIQNLVNALSQPFVIVGHELFISISIGASLYPEDSADASTLIRYADAALYRAKEKGRNNLQFYSADLGSKAFKRLTLGAKLHHAISDNQFIIHYQPQVGLKSWDIVGFEALIRWQHPELGLVSPLDFIPLLEETGMMVDVGEWVLRTACVQARQWQEKHKTTLCISVNLSGRQFNDSDMVNMIGRTLQEIGVDPQLLELEVTESILMQDNQMTMDNLHALEKMNIRLAIDDFGTGYSSLSYLKRFPVHTLKIDRSFIQDISDDQDDAAIVSAIIAMAHNLKLRVIAEGVETQQQLDFLRECGCDEVQGYWFSRPLPVDEMEQLLQHPVPFGGATS